MKNKGEKNSRREFLKISGLTGLSLLTPGGLNAFTNSEAMMKSMHPDVLPNLEESISLIGPYGPWAASLTDGKLPSLSWRNAEFSDVNAWKQAARSKLTERMGIPALGGLPTVQVKKKYDFDGLAIEEVSWQLPYGHPSEAIVLKPKGAKGKLPGILAFHDHGGNKYFGKQKIVKTSDALHPMLTEHQQTYYSGLAWANEVAKRGYVVMVPDAFPFESRRVLLAEVPEYTRQGLTDNDHSKPENIEAYNRWAGQHEHIMAKSLFSAGTSWPAVFLAEDQKALDILCAREDVDAAHVGCGGLSGGGMRTVFLAGLDDRIKCAVSVGFMTTWKDFVLHKSITHTWMIYVPRLPHELDFPEILGLRVPLASLVLNNSEDSLFTLSEMQRADKILTEVYQKAKASDRYKTSFYPGPHKFDADMQKEAFNWFDRFLK
jgi:dienelactone hydrolase